MTTITFYRNRNGDIIGFNGSGHANDHARSGKDIVCAAVSVLTQTIGEGIREILGANTEKRSDENTGFYELVLNDKNSGEVFEKAQVLLKTLELGIQSIISNREYRRFVQINYSERR